MPTSDSASETQQSRDGSTPLSGASSRASTPSSTSLANSKRTFNSEDGPDASISDSSDEDVIPCQPAESPPRDQKSRSRSLYQRQTPKKDIKVERPAERPLKLPRLTLNGRDLGLNDTLPISQGTSDGSQNEDAVPASLDGLSEVLALHLISFIRIGKSLPRDDDSICNTDIAFSSVEKIKSGPVKSIWI